MLSRCLVLRAEEDPMPGVQRPGPHQLYRNPRLAVEERELGPLHSEEIRVQMLYAGLCGTDIHLVQAHPVTGYVSCSAPASIPQQGRIIGHEGVGRVVAVGANVRHIQPNMIVTFESIIHCHCCEVCRRGDFNQCICACLLGLEKDGVFGTIVDVPAMLAHDVTWLAETSAGLKAAACVEPAGVAYVACEKTHISGGDVVVVFGGGPIGLLTGLLSLHVFGAAEVHLVEPVAYRRELARQWLPRVYDVDEFFAAKPSVVNVLIEASGCMTNVTRLFRSISANGRVALLARGGAPLLLDAVDHMITNAISISGSRGHLGGAFARVLQLYRSGRFDPGCVVTHVLCGLDELCETLLRPENIAQTNCKVLVELSTY